MPSLNSIVLGGSAAAAWGLLWAFGFYDGLMPTLVDAIRAGELPDGTPLRTVYTHIPGIDHLHSVGIAFFYNLSRHAVHKIFLTNMYLTLSATFTLFMIESLRPSVVHGKKRKYLQNPAVWFMAAQALGGATVLPIYYLQHINDAATVPTSRVAQYLPSNKSKALILATIIGTLVPTWYTFGPAEVGRTPDEQQLFLTLWFFWPLYTAGLTSVIAPLLAQKESLKTRQFWTTIVYMFALLLSVAGNGYQRKTAYETQIPDLAWVQVFLPNYLQALNPENGLVEKAKFFLQVDWWLMTLPALFWAIALWRRDRQTDGWALLKILVGARFAWTILDTMGVVSGMMLYKELTMEDEKVPTKTEVAETKKEL